MSAIRERLFLRYSKIFWLRAKGQRFVVELTFSSLLVFLLLRWKTANTVFVVLSFSFKVWRYLPRVAMSLLITASVFTACQSPSACMIAGSLAYAYLFGGGGWQVRGVDVEMKVCQRVWRDSCGTPFVSRCNQFRLFLPMVRVKLRRSNYLHGHVLVR